ncbi:hypothetical protein GCM10027169_25860 [Gordonia jinhuaensis]|uniref:Uncharacterized protein n=1 Tax=Gordonia jinhuaensis TaxID=1517702 RepID=A0A916TBA3_9ACTN|nr:hypothetical protein [Gordonia jinhuaensis]GGB38884.1 hypothetical protein GCM10011489_28250 [Gordonia jinhuaensis]
MVEAVQVGGADIDKATETARSKCSTMTLDSNVSGQQIHSVNTSSVFDLPHNEADKSVGIKMTSTATIAGTEVTTTSLLAIAQVGGYSVVTSVGGTRSAPSQSTFDDFTTKAIAKVAAAS